MKTLAALAFALFATTACATEPTETTDGLELRHAGDTIEGSLVEADASINFRITQLGQKASFEIETREGYKRVETIHLSSTQLDLVRRVPRVLAAQGIDIENAITATPELGEILCPTRPSNEMTMQTESLDLDRN